MPLDDVTPIKIHVARLICLALPLMRCPVRIDRLCELCHCNYCKHYLYNLSVDKTVCIDRKWIGTVAEMHLPIDSDVLGKYIDRCYRQDGRAYTCYICEHIWKVVVCLDQR